MNPEHKIENEIKEYLHKKGYYYFKINQPHRHARNKPGIADLYAIRNGVSFWIEVKTPTGTQSDAQIKFESNIKDHGGNYIIARSVEDLRQNKI